MTTHIIVGEIDATTPEPPPLTAWIAQQTAAFDAAAVAQLGGAA